MLFCHGFITPNQEPLEPILDGKVNEASPSRWVEMQIEFEKKAEEHAKNERLKKKQDMMIEQLKKKCDQQKDYIGVTFNLIRAQRSIQRTMLI